MSREILSFGSSSPLIRAARSRGMFVDGTWWFVVEVIGKEASGKTSLTPGVVRVSKHRMKMERW